MHTVALIGENIPILTCVSADEERASEWCTIRFMWVGRSTQYRATTLPQFFIYACPHSTWVKKKTIQNVNQNLTQQMIFIAFYKDVYNDDVVWDGYFIFEIDSTCSTGQLNPWSRPAALRITLTVGLLFIHLRPLYTGIPGATVQIFGCKSELVQVETYI